MLILAFESSAKAASVALCRDGHLVSQYSQCSGLTHSRTLLPMAEDMLKNAELSIGDVDVFAVAHGPGSFTGIRIGVSTVKGLAWASDKPCIGVSTLEAMAWHGVSAGGYVCPVMDARRSQVYNAIFKIEGGRPVRMTADRPISLEDLASELLAEHLDADMLIILTAVEKVAVNFNKPNQKWLDTLTPEEARTYIGEGQFAPGSMLPKVEAAVKFAESKPGRTALITLLEKARDGIDGKTGTRITC